jgi:hypothetical protein
MTANLLIFPLERTHKHRQAQVNEALSADPNYRFIRDLLVAIEDVGFHLDRSPEAKAHELYSRYQRENRFVRQDDEVEPGLDTSL